MKRLLLLLSLLGLIATATHGAAKGPEPVVISRGETVTLADHLVPGKTVVFDFTSKFCPPCRAYDEPLRKLHATREDLVVVKVDINRPSVRGIDWQSPVAQQFELRSIPHFKVFGPDGRLLAEDKLILGPDGRPTSRESKARAIVDQWLNDLK